MPCSAQNVVTDPRGASGGHCDIARRIRASTGSFFGTGQVEPPPVAADHSGEVSPPRTLELSPMSCDMTSPQPQPTSNTNGLEAPAGPDTRRQDVRHAARLASACSPLGLPP